MSPGNLIYKPLNITYTAFLQFCFNNDLNKFYEGKRWTNWQTEVSKLNSENVFSFYPFLWTKEGKDIDKNVQNGVPVEEQYNYNPNLQKQPGLNK